MTTRKLAVALLALVAVGTAGFAGYRLNARPEPKPATVNTTPPTTTASRYERINGRPNRAVPTTAARTTTTTKPVHVVRTKVECKQREMGGRMCLSYLITKTLSNGNYEFWVRTCTGHDGPGICSYWDERPSDPKAPYGH